jgi:hypothetical protein
MEIVDLVADSEKVAAHFRCSGTHLGEWMGHPPTGKRFHDVDEIYILRVSLARHTGTVGTRACDTALGNLAAIHRYLEQPGDALPLEERTLAIGEAPQDPTTPAQPPG